MKMENYGLCIADSDEAIKLDPNYAKAYYRKADANIAIDKYDLALNCLKTVEIFTIFIYLKREFHLFLGDFKVESSGC